MPRYDYRCTSCGKTFEVSHGMRERPPISCPDCGGSAQRLFDASGIVLKGSGFYNTDQRGKKGATAATGGKDPEATASAGQGPSAPSDSKPAAAPAAKTGDASKAQD